MHIATDRIPQSSAAWQGDITGGGGKLPPLPETKTHDPCTTIGRKTGA
jgi:hypothetical protein